MTGSTPWATCSHAANNLESIHEQFARLFSSTLSGTMRMVVDVDLAFVDQVLYSEFILSLNTPCSAYSFTMDPPGSPAVLCFAPELLMAAGRSRLRRPGTRLRRRAETADPDRQ